MPDLYDAIKVMVENILNSYGLADYRIGTVISTSPLQIKISDRVTLDEDQLILTRAVIHRTIDCSHVHETTANVSSSGEHSHSVTGKAESIEGESEVKGSTDSAGGHTHTVSIESDALGLPEPIVIVEGLELGDKVILLSVHRDQIFIVLSKLERM